MTSHEDAAGEPRRPLPDVQVLRHLMAGLRAGDHEPDVVGILTRRAARRRPLGGLPSPPAWASHSVVEEGGVTHERVSPRHPRSTVPWPPTGDAFGVPTDVSVSVVDRPGAGRWVRTAPRIQVEGGSFSIVEARRLVRAIEELVAAVM